jgi:DNA-binding MarR family transcriptional regulator
MHLNVLNIARSKQHSTMSVRALAILAALDDGECGTAELAEHIGISKPAITRLTHSLAEQGLIVCQKAREDKRHRHIALTEDGSAFLAFAATTM